MFEKATIVCFVVCFGFTDSSDPVPLDDYCQRYERVVITDGDKDAIKKLPLNIQKRIQGNEVDYLCKCLKWEHKVCN
jgi:hypothetical protein